ncbi:DNA sulfur modification protein DndB [Rossellomorea sp. NPDC071047]|uniref:DNA sulfur modification protein DndB n=1 Tax=Rossellomorea sp. NPDC071047 TaxID=3390675 RepID=UPI003D038A66
MSATFVKLNGTEGMQFGRKFYNITLKFHELADFLNVFKDVQRNIDRNKVNSLAEYTLKGLKDKNTSFITSLTTTCRGDILYNHSKEEINIDVNSVLSVNDGQHRFKGILKAIAILEKQIKQEKDKNKKFLLSRKLEGLKNMEIPVVIYAGINEDMERQLFHDLNNLAKKPTKSTSLKFDQTNYYTKVAKYLAENNNFFISYGVETNKASLSKKNPNLFLLTGLTNSVSLLLTGSDKHNHDLLNEETFDDVRGFVNDTFNKLFNTLPEDINNREKYIFGKSIVLQGISKFIYKAKNLGFSEESIFHAISVVDWTYSEKWIEFGAKIENGNITFSGSGTGINSVYKAIMFELEPTLV